MSRKTEYTGRYKLSKNEFGYAKWYSLKYYEWLDEYNTLKDSVKAIQYSDVPKGSGKSDPTEKLAERRAELRRKMLKIENAAVDAGGDIAKYILLAVINEDMTFDKLKAQGMPCERTYFYDKRRKYYWLLSKEI